MLTSDVMSAMGITQTGDRQLVTRRADQMGTFNTLVSSAITLIIGVLVYNEVFASLPNVDGAINGTSVSNTVESAFTLAPVVLIVLVAVLVLANIGGLAGGGGNGGGMR